MHVWQFSHLFDLHQASNDTKLPAQVSGMSAMEAPDDKVSGLATRAPSFVDLTIALTASVSGVFSGAMLAMVSELERSARAVILLRAPNRQPAETGRKGPVALRTGLLAAFSRLSAGVLVFFWASRASANHLLIYAHHSGVYELIFDWPAPCANFGPHQPASVYENRKCCLNVWHFPKFRSASVLEVSHVQGG